MILPWTTVKPLRRDGFTLVELLVVISIIGLLISILLPALSESRMQGIRLVTSNNIRQLQLAFAAYAVDNKLGFPTIVRPAQVQWGCFAPDALPANATKLGYRTCYNAVRDYGAMPATAHPGVGAPSWNKSTLGGEDPTQTTALPNNNGSVLRGFTSPYALCFGYTPTNVPASSTVWLGTPNRMDKFTPSQNFVGELLVSKYNSGGTVTTSYLFTQPRRLGYRRVQNEGGIPGNTAFNLPNNPCDLQYREDWAPLIGPPLQMAGAYMGKADGSVVWYPTSAMNFSVNPTPAQALPMSGLFWKYYSTGGWSLAGQGDF